jgi:hypothetical protein
LVLPAQVLLSVSKLTRWKVPAIGWRQIWLRNLQRPVEASWSKGIVLDVRAMGFAMDRQLHSGGLLASFPVVLLSQPNSGTPSVLVDKLNPGFFKRTSHRQVIGHGHGGFILRTLSPLDCRNAQRSFTGKVFGAPS